MKSKICLLLLVFTLFLGLACFVKAQTDQVYWSDDFNYASNQDMKSAGWTLYRNPSGISVGSGALTLDGTDGDAIVYYHNHFASGIYDWKVETKSMWLGQGHTTNGVFILTEKHSYGFNADGYYKEFAFYRDNKKILHFGIFEEKANQWITIALVREGNTIKMYFNGNLQNTYQEEDTEKSAAIGVDISSPWQGNAKYDYVMLGTPNAVMQNTSPPETTSNFPLSTVLIGGGLAAVIVAGVAIYYFFIAGGNAGASAGSATGNAGGGFGSSGGGSSVIQDQQISPLTGENTNSSAQQATLFSEQLDNVTQTQSILQDINAEILNESPNMFFIDDGLYVGESQNTTNTGLLTSGNTFQNLIPTIEEALSLGEQVVQQGTSQNSIEQNSLQQYLEYTTNIVDMLSNILKSHHQTNMSGISNMR